MHSYSSTAFTMTWVDHTFALKHILSAFAIGPYQIALLRLYFFLLLRSFLGSGHSALSIDLFHIDGQWSAWAPFVCSQCSCSSVAGSVGLTLSARSCSNPAPQNGGSECEGSTQRAAVCNRKCSGSTSVNQYISDKCAEHKRVKNDEELSGTGSQLSRFPQRACKVFCDVKDTLGSQRSYRFYGDNLPDGTPCGFDRFCLAGECFDLSCDESALLPRDLGCPPVSERCPLVSAAALSSAPSTALSGGAQPAPNSLENVKGSWGTWSLWSSCTTTCGGGFQMRSRTCNINNRCEGSPTEKMVCNTQACPTTNTQVGDQWTDWTSWNQCSVSCGRGSQARYRRCTTPQSTIAYTCPGQTMDIRTCDELPCSNKPSSSVGLWASWGDWGTCSKTCGPGTQTRYRQCTKEPCDGAGQQPTFANVHSGMSGVYFPNAQNFVVADLDQGAEHARAARLVQAHQLSKHSVMSTRAIQALRLPQVNGAVGQNGVDALNRRFVMMVHAVSAMLVGEVGDIGASARNHAEMEYGDVFANAMVAEHATEMNMNAKIAICETADIDDIVFCSVEYLLFSAMLYAQTLTDYSISL
ncbi:thrombospondin type 1 domain-containing protein [Ditylenchus destructor]|nr:thrombospondin type 1 domain-containing protein [Ditylenchus destructor]